MRAAQDEPGQPAARVRAHLDVARHGRCQRRVVRRGEDGRVGEEQAHARAEAEAREEARVAEVREGRRCLELALRKQWR